MPCQVAPRGLIQCANIDFAGCGQGKSLGRNGAYGQAVWDHCPTAWGKDARSIVALRLARRSIIGGIEPVILVALEQSTARPASNCGKTHGLVNGEKRIEKTVRRARSRAAFRAAILLSSCLDQLPCRAQALPLSPGEQR
ncbi:MAG TPA: hypothetical protein PKX75_21525 [Nitrospira sp.]|nr:hypothetical protein [Accumulibacter sp.]HNK51602.1 hypothetical protein [Nitrospira sp.]HNL15354.1 hypothetical protein [Accumulibacter sp.]